MSSALSMFRKTASHGDVKKSAQKVSDPKKDTVTRLKHLRQVLESYDVSEAKSFFDANYSHIYYIFNDNFATVEADLKQRANRAHREELDSILHIFEKILLLLPELVHKGWMFHSIGRTLKKLLHPGNCLKTRKDGMRLFIIWYQILQDNASDECHQIFLQLVPGLGEGINQDMLIGKPPSSNDSCSGMIAAGEILPILPSSGEAYPDNITKHFFNELLHYMVTEVVKVEWLNKDMREASFIFLFNKFKSTYLDWILPDFDHKSDIYEPVLEMPRIRTMLDMKTKDLPANVSECRDSYIRWLAHFVTLSKKQDQSEKDPSLLEGTGRDDDVREVQEPKIDSTENMPGSNTSTLSTASRSSEHDSPNSSLCYDANDDENEIVKNVLYSTRENVNIVHESFRQALLFSFNHSKAIKIVIAVYRDWFQHADQKPIFMQEPCDGLHIGHRTPEYYHSLSDIVEEEGSSDESAPCSTGKPLLSLECIDDKSGIRNASYLGAIQDLADGGECCKNDIRAGVQKVLQVFITNAANIFLLEAEDDVMLGEQVELCKRVVNIYRFLVMNMKLEQKTWEKMLEVLLCITSGVLQEVPSENKIKTLGGKLAPPIFQTLIVTWIKANLNVFISLDLWDQFLKVLSSLTSWPELVREWAKTMETLTRVLARQVYNLDLHDLPLDRLSEQKEKRRRGRSQDLTKSKINDRSFSRGWSKSEPQGSDKTSQTVPASPHIPFERGKYACKSDGAGGTKSRPDLSKQRSLSGEPSPSHSRTPSNASDSALYVRSSSEGNLSEELVERLKASIGLQLDENKKPFDSPQSACTVSIAVSSSDTSESIGAVTNSSNNEDQEVAEITTASVECNINRTNLDTCALLSDPFLEQSSDSISLEKSEQESTLKYSCTPSPTSFHSRTPSPTSELTVDVSSHSKHCPTPDQDSLHIEMDTSDEIPLSKESLEDLKSVLSGGSVQGWMPDVAVVLWRRMLGSLGNINKIEDADNHAAVLEELSYLLETLNKMRINLGVTADNMNSPPPPELIPPLHIFSPWLFECLTLPEKYKRGKLVAYQLLCQMIAQRHTVPLPSELVSQFYLALHQGFNLGDQDVTNVLVRYCGAKFFSISLPGSTLLVQTFIDAVGDVITHGQVKESPRIEGLSILGSLVCFPNHLMEIQVLETKSLSVLTLHCDELKEKVINQLLKAGKKEPAPISRCVAVSGIGIFLYEELMHGTLHLKLNEAVLVLLGCLRCVYKRVAKTASDMLALLCDHSEKLLSYHSELPKRIIEVIASTLLTLIPVTGISVTEEEKQLIISMMFCMVEWCTKIPMHLLLETTDTDKGCLHKIFHVLDVAVKNHTVESLTQAKQSLAGMLQDADFEYLRDLSNIPRKPSSDSLSSATTATTAEKTESKTGDVSTVQIAAKTLICHLVNHLCHFPMGAGASQLNTAIQEYQDFDESAFDDLKPDIYCMPNLQFFVLNKRTLVSFIELAALLDVPGGGVTSGLTTARTVCRVLLRDLTGKYSWESSVLYAPPWCLQGSSIKNAKYLLGLTTESELEPLLINEECNVAPPPSVHQRPSTEIPHYQTTEDGQDNLNDMLRYIGLSSPECLLIPGVQLNVEAPVPEGLSENCEETMTESVVYQKHAELNYYNKHKSDASMLAKPQIPTEIEDPISPFQICRMLIDQIGLLAWEKRCDFDLLKKTDKLLRELKNLDNQKCRETHKFAVIYVAVGQEDKNTILSNSGGSKAFEEFVSGLGWEVELETHQGFLGGLQQNKTTGDTAPYYASSLCECIFHVSTRMPSGTDEARHIKMRHLGNDEVHIVWSEHTREYRRDIIPTEFGDVLIIIYPLPNVLKSHLRGRDFAIDDEVINVVEAYLGEQKENIYIEEEEITRLEHCLNKCIEVLYFGPLFEGAIVDRKVLPGLVRATAINASRVKRSLMPFYHPFYEERAKCFDTVIEQHVEKTTFEDFSANVFAPVLPPNSTISDNSLEIPPSSSSSSIEQSSQYLEVSPPTGRQSRGNDGFTRSGRRLSWRSRKSSSKISQQIVTPPLSPSLKCKKS